MNYYMSIARFRTQVLTLNGWTWDDHELTRLVKASSKRNAMIAVEESIEREHERVTINEIVILETIIGE